MLSLLKTKSFDNLQEQLRGQPPIRTEKVFHRAEEKKKLAQALLCHKTTLYLILYEIEVLTGCLVCSLYERTYKTIGYKLTQKTTMIYTEKTTDIAGASQPATINDLAHFVDTLFFKDEIDCDDYLFFHKICEQFTKQKEDA